jgi:DNA-binding transcriptional ArsR family regulator
MSRIHFTNQSLARTMFSTVRSRVIEGLFALRLLDQREVDDQFAGWRKHVETRMGRRARQLTTLARGIGPARDLLRLLERPAEFDGSALLGLPAKPQYLVSAVENFDRIALKPYWRSVSMRLVADCAHRGRIVLDDGVERLFTTLNRGVHWASPVLEIADGTSRDIYLDGSGLVLTPSVFLSDGSAVVIDGATPGDPPTLVFPTAEAATLGELKPGSDVDTLVALGALVGRTRAAIIQALQAGCTTSDLSRRIGITPAAASQHTGILRESGLITSHRRMNTVLHTLTPLGVVVLAGTDPMGRPDLVDATGGAGC